MSFAEFWSQLGLDKRYCVYILYSADDQALYIGRTGDLKARLQQHYSTQPWIEEVAEIRLIEGLDFKSATIQESLLISSLSPKYNIMGTAAEEDIVFQEIVKHRLALGWSQRKLAAAVGVSTQTIVNTEKGHYHPRWNTMQKIIEVLEEGEVSLDNASSS